MQQCSLELGRRERQVSGYETCCKYTYFLTTLSLSFLISSNKDLEEDNFWSCFQISMVLVYPSCHHSWNGCKSCVGGEASIPGKGQKGPHNTQSGEAARHELSSGLTPLAQGVVRCERMCAAEPGMGAPEGLGGGCPPPESLGE